MTITVTVDHITEEVLLADEQPAKLAALLDPAAEAPDLQVVEPITLEQAKAHLRVVVADDDAYILGLVSTARQMAEGRLNRTLVQRRRVAVFPCWISGMSLLKPPVISVDSIGYVDETGGEMMLDPTRFYLPPANEDEVPQVELQPGEYPVLARGRRDAVRVYYTAGYPVGEVPAPIAQWILLAIGTMYENRATLVNGTISVPLAGDFARWLLQPLQVYE